MENICWPRDLQGYIFNYSISIPWANLLSPFYSFILQSEWTLRTEHLKYVKIWQVKFSCRVCMGLNVWTHFAWAWTSERILIFTFVFLFKIMNSLGRYDTNEAVLAVSVFHMLLFTSKQPSAIRNIPLLLKTTIGFHEKKKIETITIHFKWEENLKRCDHRNWQYHTTPNHKFWC